MGFGTFAANILMFIAILTVGATLVGVFTTYTEETASAMSVKTDALKNSLETDITIVNVIYNTTLNHTFVYLLNTGNTELSINNTDAFIDGVFIPRGITKDMTIEPTTHIRNARLWDPGEMLVIQINKTLQNETTHSVDIVTEYGTRDSEVFSN